MKIFDIDRLIETFTKYSETKVELLKIELKEEISRLLAKAIALLILGVSSLFFILFLCLSLASFLNEILASAYWGYLIISGLFLSLTVISGVSKDKIYRNFMEKIHEMDNSTEEG